MPKFEVTTGNSMLDVLLTPTRASTAEIEVRGKRMVRTVIELSHDEIVDWERVSEEYQAWAAKIEDLSIAARRAASTQRSFDH